MGFDLAVSLASPTLAHTNNSSSMSVFAKTQMESKYSHTKQSGHKENWHEIAYRQAHSVVKPYSNSLNTTCPNNASITDHIHHMISTRKFIPGGRYLYAAGRRYPQISNCFLFGSEDSREGWGNLLNKTANALMTGGGIGVVYSPIRPYGTPTGGMGGIATGPCSLAGIINEQGRRIMQGGSRRSAIWAGLHWWHKDIFTFIGYKEWPEIVRQQKLTDFNFPGELDMTNISVILDNAFFEAYSNPSFSRTYTVGNCPCTVDHNWAQNVYWSTVRSMLRSGEPGFSVDIGDNEGENLRNACTEITSRDDSDMCNLGSMNLAQYTSLEEFTNDIQYATAFLLCGTLYGKLPIESMYKVREKNRRIGLGLMGIHEWLLKRGYKYEQNSELQKWLEAYEASTAHANRWCDKLSISRSIATRSIAPTGTISMVAETTSGIEPIPAVAYMRRYLKGHDWVCQYVIDPTANRLIQQGVDPLLIEDSMTLAEDVQRRTSFQAWVQKYVDHGISSTINLPSWGSPLNNESTVNQFGTTLFKYLPELRGITAYPDGSRGGQPITRVPYHEAISQIGVEFVDSSDRTCRNGVCSS